MALFNIKNRIINLDDIATLIYDEGDLEFDVFITNIYGDKVTIPFNTLEERDIFIDSLNDIKTSKFNLMFLTNCLYINLNYITIINFYEDILDNKDVWIASITWSIKNRLPETFTLYDNKNQKDIDNLMDKIINKDKVYGFK